MTTIESGHREWGEVEVDFAGGDCTIRQQDDIVVLCTEYVDDLIVALRLWQEMEKHNDSK